MCHMMQWNQILYEIALIFQTSEVYKWVTRLQKVFNSNLEQCTRGCSRSHTLMTCMILSHECQTECSRNFGTYVHSGCPRFLLYIIHESKKLYFDHVTSAQASQFPTSGAHYIQKLLYTVTHTCVWTRRAPLSVRATVHCTL